MRQASKMSVRPRSIGNKTLSHMTIRSTLRAVPMRKRLVRESATDPIQPSRVGVFAQRLSLEPLQSVGTFELFLENFYSRKNAPSALSAAPLYMPFTPLGFSNTPDVLPQSPPDLTHPPSDLPRTPFAFSHTPLPLLSSPSYFPHTPLGFPHTPFVRSPKPPRPPSVFSSCDAGFIGGGVVNGKFSEMFPLAG